MNSKQRKSLLEYWRYELRFSLVALVTVILVALMITSSLRVHLNELEVRLQESEYLDSGAPHMHLVMRYLNQLRIYKKNADRGVVDKDEQVLRAILGADAKKKLAGIQVHSFIDQVNVHIINGMRLLMGHPPLPGAARQEISRDLELAYYYERNKEYSKALEIYARVTPDEKLKGTVWLHEGFCYALQGDSHGARAKYRMVMSDYKDQDIGVTAQILLGYLDLFEKETAALSTDSLDPVGHAEALANLMQCRAALQEFSGLLAKGENQNGRLYFYQGLCLEEFGRKTEAIRSYAKAIRMEGISPVSRDANRRIYIIGTQLSPANPVRDAAIAMNEVLQDSMFEEIRSLQFIEPPDQLRDTLYIKTQDSMIVAELATEMTETMLAVRPMEIATVDPKGRGPVRVIEIPKQSNIDVAPVPSKVRISTKDGKVYFGLLLTSPKASIVKVQTVLGVIGVAQSEIDRIE